MTIRELINKGIDIDKELNISVIDMHKKTRNPSMHEAHFDDMEIEYNINEEIIYQEIFLIINK